MSGLFTNEKIEFQEFIVDSFLQDVETGVKQYCPACGYDLHAAPGMDSTTVQSASDAPLVCCAECGCEWRHAELLASPPPGPIGQMAQAVAAWAGRSLTITLIITFVFCLIGFLMLPALAKTRCCGCRLTRPASHLRMISTGMMLYAADHNNQYPEHAALLVIGDYVGTDTFTNSKQSRPVAFVGPFQMESYDGTERSQAALRASVEAMDLSTSYYRVGDFWIVRFDQPMADGRLVSAWSFVDSTSRRSIMFEDGHVEFADAKRWPQIWQADAAARQALNLTAATTPLW